MRASKFDIMCLFLVLMTLLKLSPFNMIKYYYTVPVNFSVRL